MCEHNEPPQGVGGSVPLDDPVDAWNAIYEAIRSEIEWPYASGIEDAVYRAVANNTCTVLPPKSHLKLLEDGKWVVGVTVVAMDPSPYGGNRARVCTERGVWLSLSDDCVLVVGR